MRVPPSVSLRKNDRISPAEILAEGVLEIGRTDGSSVLFALTKNGLHLFHASCVSDRKLDAYGINMAVTMIDCGIPICDVARTLEVGDKNLRRDLAAVGFVQQSRRMAGPREGADKRFGERKRRPRFGGLSIMQPGGVTP